MALRATAGRTWRAAREEGFEQLLPSGNVARLRPVALADLVAQGKVPDLLTPLVMRMAFEGIDAEPSELHDVERGQEWTAAVLATYAAVCRAAFVSPRIVDDPQADDEIAIDDVDLFDRASVFFISTRGVETLRRFRLGPETDVDAVSDGQDDGDAAQPVDDPA